MRWHTVLPTVVTLGGMQLGFDGTSCEPPTQIQEERKGPEVGSEDTLGRGSLSLRTKDCQLRPACPVVISSSLRRNDAGAEPWRSIGQAMRALLVISM